MVVMDGAGIVASLELPDLTAHGGSRLHAQFVIEAPTTNRGIP